MPRQLSRSLMLLAAAGLALLPGCSPVKILNAAVPTGAFIKTSGVAYGQDYRQTLDIYVPKAPAPDGKPYRVVVFYYGGSWQNGRRQDYLFVGQAIASHGWIAIIPDYRTYPQVRFPGFMEDAASAFAWAQQHASSLGGDPNRMVLMGHSAGAQMAVLLATDTHYLRDRGVPPGTVKSVVGLAGPYDFLPLQDATLESIFPVSTRAASQPINFVTGHEPPMFLAAGTDDHTVDPGNTDRMAARLVAASDSVEVKHYKGLGHAPLVAVLAAPLRITEPVMNDIAQFIDSH